MPKPAAKKGDNVDANDTHIEMVTTAAGPTPTPTPHTFSGPLSEELSPDVFIELKNAAVVGSVAQNTPHVPVAGPFQSPPSNRGTVLTGSATVFINCKKAARDTDTVETCGDPTDLPVGVISASGTVFIAD